MSIPKKLKDLREDKDLTQDELAKEFKIDRKTISRMEREKYQPKTETLIMYAKFFNVSLDYICELTNTPRTIDGKPYSIKNMTQINGNNNNIKIKNS